MARKPLNITGQTFGYLTVVGPTIIKGETRWTCKCVCGAIRVHWADKLKIGRYKSCGCKSRETSVLNLRLGNKGKVLHGMSALSEYGIFIAMKRRCSDPSDISYRNYGGRGISVCERWKEFKRFYSDMGPRPGPNYSIDRKDTSGNYEPGNCKWSTRKEQARNTRKNVWFELGGERLCIGDWEERIGGSQGVVRRRLKLGWPLEKALTIPVRRKLKEAA
jgi:hypothetical protein